MSEERSRLVYSTDGTDSGRVNKPSTERSRRPAAPKTSGRRPPPDDGFVRLQRETKGRGGKTVTVVTGLPGDEAAVEALLKVLKQHCGAGGTRDGVVIEIQGDHRERLRGKLESLGHRVKMAGG